MSTKIWKTKTTDECKPKIINYIKQLNNEKSLLLDLQKTKFNYLERFVYETAMFHVKQLNSVDPSTFFVEFSCRDNFNKHNFHVDCDEYEKTNGNYIYPIQSCLSYFTKSDCPTIITNIDLDNYLYKEFETQNEVFLSFPEIDKQITFDGKFFHGYTSLSENDVCQDRYIIAINIWNTKPTNVEYYKGDNELEDEPVIISFEEDKNIDKIIVQNNMINIQLFENLLYKYDKTAMYDFNKLVNQNISSYIFTTTNLEATDKQATDKQATDKQATDKQATDKQATDKQATKNIIDDINEIMNKTLKYNRFMQRFKYSKIYTPDMCRYIINESEKYATNNGGFMTTRHTKYPTTVLPVDKIPSIFGLILETLQSIIVKIQDSYGLNEGILFNIKEMFVVKYKHDEPNHLEMHNDGSFISFNILLNNPTDFEGGGTYFEDGVTILLDQGDMLIHSGHTKHADQRITKGCQYILVGFIDIKLQNKPESDFGYCALNFE